MAIYFLDSSAIVKRYIRETGTAWVVGLTDPVARSRIYVARIAGVEVVSAITRKARGGDLSGADATNAIEEFRYDFANSYRLVEIAPSLVDRAMRLAETHGLRGYDAVQLAAALEVNSCCLALGGPVITVASADEALNEAADVEGLRVDDPNTHP